jgi:hypothetical protein
MFTPGIMAHHPLGTKDKLLSKDFPVPFSFFYGAYDWGRMLDEEFP